MTPERLRQIVFARDGETCQIDGHGLDCHALERAYYAAIAEAHAEHERERERCVMQVQGIAAGQRLTSQLIAIRQRLRALGFYHGKPFAELHHGIPLDEGGSNTPDNCVCACVPCHRRLSAEHAARRARKPLKAWHPPKVDRNGRPA
jgi:5-methylcytosine-specific restriction endonuclease McrA